MTEEYLGQFFLYSAHPWKLEEEEEEEEEEERVQMMYDILKTKKHQTKQRYTKRK